MGQLADTKVRLKVFDVETTATDGDPDWVHSANNAVLWGVLDPDVASQVSMSEEAGDVVTHLWDDDYGHILLIGHNLMFDIGYAHKQCVLSLTDLATRINLWDTMTVEYILSGQETKFASLENLCARYSIPFVKDPSIKGMFEAGHGADSVPMPLLKNYLEKDLRATYQVFLSQYDRAVALNMLPLIFAMMDFRAATIAMRINGVAINTEALAKTRDICEQTSDKAKEEAETRLVHVVKHMGILAGTFDITKPPQLANLLFGGIRKVKKVVDVGVYKNGKTKTKIVEEDVAYKGALELLGIAHTLEKSADEETLEEITELLTDVGITGALGTAIVRREFAEVFKSILLYRKAQKILKTYVEPTHLDCLRFGDTIHPTIHTCSTNTGRTSCASPNLQNVPKNSLGRYRSCIVANGGQLAEFDYEQLEVVALALLSKDEQLIRDIKDGVDMHAALYEEVHGRKPTKEERRQFKRAVFCLIYGGGPNAIAAQGNTTPSQARRVMSAWAARYPDTMKFRAAVLDKVKANSMVCPIRKYGIPHRESIWESPTGRLYHFEQKLRKPFSFPGILKRGTVGPHCDWSEQETANYPIQGLATADMVPLMIGMLYRYIYSAAYAKEFELFDPYPVQPILLMAVHDSVLMEIDEVGEHRTVKLIKFFLESLPLQMLKVFGVDCGTLPFKVGVSVGHNWDDMVDVV